MGINQPKASARLMLFVGGMLLTAGVIGLVAKQYAFLGFFGLGAVYLALGARQLRRLDPPKQ